MHTYTHTYNKLMYYHLKTRCYVRNVNQCIVLSSNDVTGMSPEQRLITKEHIATHTNLILLFKPPLYSSTLVIKCSIKLF